MSSTPGWALVAHIGWLPGRRSRGTIVTPSSRGRRSFLCLFHGSGATMRLRIVAARALAQFPAAHNEGGSHEPLFSDAPQDRCGPADWGSGRRPAGLWRRLAGPITKVAKVIPARGARISSALDTPFDLDIVASAGVCPRGLKVGDRIAVDEAGGLSVSLCRVAIAAIDRVGTSKASANCVCPLEDQRMTFAIAAIVL